MSENNPSIEQLAQELQPLAVTPEETPVRVRVFRDDSGIKIECSRAIPELRNIAKFLSKPQQKEIKTHIDWGRSVKETITRSSIPFQDWANAIGEAIIQADADSLGGSFETNALKEPAYLTLGDTLFKLSPVELIKTNKALTAVKKRASDKADVAIKKKLADGQLAADALIEAAHRLKREAEDNLRRASRAQPVPQWAMQAGIPCKWNGSTWAVELTIYFSIEYFDVGFLDGHGAFKKYRWDAVSQPTVPIRLWVPIQTDGSYAITSIYVDGSSPEIPHISNGAACMSLGDAPNRILSHGDLFNLQYSIERCMKGVQLDSLRTPLRGWLPSFKDSVPEALYEVLKGNDWTKAADLAKRLDAASPVPVEEGETTWTS